MIFWQGAQTPVLADAVTVVSETAPAPPSETRVILHSNRIGRDFQVTVDMPFSTVLLPGQKFPAIYALDGGYGLAGPQGVLLGMTGAMAPAIIVSVGYPPGDKTSRADDLLYNSVTLGQTTLGGGGAAFAAFLCKDLEPFIEARFPADPARSFLFGHSFGALFAANLFSDRPDAFAGYVIGSASVWADPPVVKRVSGALGRAHGQRIYLSVGDLEDRGDPDGGAKMADGFKDLAAALQAQPGVVLKTRAYPGENHLSYYPRLVADSFPFLLPPVLPLGAPLSWPAPETTKAYVGVYDMPDGRKITVTSTPKGPMSAQVTGGRSVILFPNGKDRFYTLGFDLNITFDEAGATLNGLGGGRLRVVREKTPGPASFVGGRGAGVVSGGGFSRRDG